MIRILKKHSAKAGLPPGTMVHIGEEPAGAPKITVFDYSEEEFEERLVPPGEELTRYRDKPTMTWINVDGMHDLGLIERLGQEFGLHPLTTEDIVNTDQRPKVEDFGDYLYIVVRMLQYDPAEEEVVSEQVSLVLGKGFVLSFQETIGDVFDPIRERLRKRQSRIRKSGPDYLVYRLLDSVVDGYFYVLEKVGERIEALEEELVEHPAQDTPRTILDLKREMFVLRKAIAPLRDVVTALEHSDSELLLSTTSVYLRDVYDHAMRVSETIETFREMVSVLLEIYQMTLSNRLNQVMKVLTTIATIFIPVTFVASIYGMNFEHMPELSWTWGYPLALGVMAASIGAMAVYFKRKKWL